MDQDVPNLQCNDFWSNYPNTFKSRFIAFGEFHRFLLKGEYLQISRWKYFHTASWRCLCFRLITVLREGTQRLHVQMCQIMNVTVLKILYLFLCFLTVSVDKLTIVCYRLLRKHDKKSIGDLALSYSVPSTCTCWCCYRLRCRDGDFVVTNDTDSSKNVLGTFKSARVPTEGVYILQAVCDHSGSHSTSR